MDSKTHNILNIKTREEFRSWLKLYGSSETECYLELKRGKPVDGVHFWYIDAVEEALCFGWIDSTLRLIDGRRMQRFSPRSKSGNWTELNKERVRRLEKLGLMTDAGRKVLPPLDDDSFSMDPQIARDLEGGDALEAFLKLPALYQRVRADNLLFTKRRDAEAYEKMLQHTIETVREGKTFGQWNDYGRLIDY